MAVYTGPIFMDAWPFMVVEYEEEEQKIEWPGRILQLISCIFKGTGN